MKINLLSKNIFKINFYLHQNDECGRSVVEILGVLAIMGVLSVGSVMGYTYGMNKYRSNKTSQDINLCMLSLMTSSHSSGATEAPNEWKEETLYPMSIIQEGSNGKSAVSVSGVPQEVCDILFDDLIGVYPIKVGEISYTETADNVCSEINDMLFYLPQGVTSADQEKELQKCGASVCTVCQTCDTTTETCVAAPKYTIKCMAETVSGWCVNGECQADACAACGPNQYCGDSNASSVNARPSSCKDLKFKEVVLGEKTYLYSEDKLSWWDSKSACVALNKKMVSIDEIVTGVDWSKAGTAGYYRGATLNAIGIGLQEKIGESNWIWSDTFCSGCSSPAFFGVNMKDGYIGTGSRNSASRFAVCY